MASRFTNSLRKNAKAVLVVMGVVCMITFVVGPYLLDLVVGGQRSQQAKSPVAVTWTKGSIHERELEHFRFQHIKSVQFLANVIFTAIQQGGKPMVEGRQMTQEDVQRGSLSVGFPEDSSDESLMQTMVLAEEAKRMGVAVDLEAVKAFLKQISAPELGEADWNDIAKETIGTQGGMTVQQLLEHVAVELKAQHVRMLAMAGLYGQGAGPIIPPGEAWNYFNRLNRRLAIEAYPIEVEPLVSQVKAEPTTAELQKLFDEGKFLYPNPNIDEPGFRKPHKLAFTYLKVNFQPYLEAAKKQITDEQVKAEYEKDVAAGRHKVQEIKGLAPEGAVPPEGTVPPQEKKGEAKEGDKPAEAEKKDTERKDTEKAAAEKPNAKKHEGEKAAEKPADERPAQKSETGCQDEQPAQAEKAAEPKVEDKPVEGKPVEAKIEDKPADAKANEAKPAETKADETKPAETKPPETRVKPLEEVADEIRTRLAQPIAEEARKKDVAEVTSAIEKYGDRYRRFENMKAIKKDGKAADPGKLDIEALAAKFNFQVGKTELADQFEIAKTEIGKNVEQFDMQAARRGQFRMMSFAELAYSEDEPLYRPHEVRSNEQDIFYVYYRTAEEKPADITLLDVKKEVMDFWKRQKAFELAKADAEKLAAKAKGAKALREVVADPAKIVSPPAFSWMTTGSIGFGGGRPEYSRPLGIELAGRDFMQAVFALSPGEAGTAPNNSHRIVYVVRVISQDPDDEQLRQQFLESGYNQLVMMIAQSETGYTSGQWWQGIEEKYQVKWQRPPRAPGMDRM